MRWVHLTVIILLAAATLLFVLQNRDVVTVLSGIQGPRASRNSDCSRYVIGAVTGGSLFALCVDLTKARNAIARSKSRSAEQPSTPCRLSGSREHKPAGGANHRFVLITLAASGH